MVGEIWGHIFMMHQPSGKIWGLCVWQSKRRLGASCVFTQLMKRFEKDLQVRMRRCMLKSISYFFSVNELDHLSNISMNRTVEQLAENSEEKKRTTKRT